MPEHTDTADLEPPHPRYTPSNCPHCEEQEERGWIATEPCSGCNPDAEHPR